jgi:O-antigen ligase
MRTLAPRATEITLTLTLIVTSLVAAIGILKFGAGPIAILCIVPWCVVLFHRHPLLLVLLWPAMLFLELAMPNYETLRVAGGGERFFLTLMDPVYFFTAIYLMIHATTRPKEFLRALQANPFLSFFLIIVIIYIVLYTPLYGKSALGEARKFYFPFFFPILALVSIQELGSLRRLLLAMFFVAIGISTVGLLHLATGAGLKGIAPAAAALLLLFTAFSIIVCHLNSIVIINKVVDTVMLVLFLSIVIMTQHRSVVLAGVVSLLGLFVIYINRAIVLSKMVTTLIVMLAVLGVIIINVPQFASHTERLRGIVAPQEDDTASWRIRGWQQQLNRVVSNNQWLFGEGLGGYYHWRERNLSTVKVYPHNGYVQMILKFGLFGLCIYVLLAGQFFLTTMKARSKLSPGPRRAYVEMGLLNFGAMHAYCMGYDFDPSCMIFVALAMVAVQLREVSWRSPRAV